MSFKKSIGWSDLSINPIKGMCKGGCFYCWTKPLYKRKFLQPEIRLDLSVFDNLPFRKGRHLVRKKIFLCSTHDLFGDWISKEWRNKIFGYTQRWSQHTFQILTKFPQNIDRPMPDNVWLGVTFTGDSDMYNAIKIKDVKAMVKFASFEPMLYFPGRGILARKLLPFLEHINWIILGRLTGYGKKYDPKRSWIDSIVRDAKKANIPIFLKDNLQEIWGDNLIQEMPE